MFALLVSGLLAATPTVVSKRVALLHPKMDDWPLHVQTDDVADWVKGAVTELEAKVPADAPPALRVTLAAKPCGRRAGR